MKYLVHYGYIECDGLEFFNSKEEVDLFLSKETSRFKEINYRFWFRVYEVGSVNDITDEFSHEEKIG